MSRERWRCRGAAACRTGSGPRRGRGPSGSGASPEGHGPPIFIRPRVRRREAEADRMTGASRPGARGPSRSRRRRASVGSCSAVHAGRSPAVGGGRGRSSPPSGWGSTDVHLGGHAVWSPGMAAAHGLRRLTLADGLLDAGVPHGLSACIRTDTFLQLDRHVPKRVECSCAPLLTSPSSFSWSRQARAPTSRCGRTRLRLPSFPPASARP